MEDTYLTRKTVAEYLAENARFYPDDTAFIFDDIRYSWRETDVISDHIAVHMQRDGIGKGTHIGFWSLNTVSLVFYLLAAMKIGAVSAAINYSYRRFELENVLKAADITRLYLGENKKGSDYAGMAEEVKALCPKLEKILPIEPSLRSLLTYLTGDAVTEEEWRALAERKKAVSADDVTVISFTSGTTKVPKPVMLSQYNILNNAAQFAAVMRVSHKKRDVLLAPLPLFHCSGLTGMLMFALVAAIPAVILRMFRADEALCAVERYRVTVLMAVPSMLELMTEQLGKDAYDISSLRIAQTSGAGISKERLREVIAALGFETFTMGYGQTECSPLICATRCEDSWERVLSTSGRPLPYVELRIWNLEEGRKAVVGETGEIQVRGFLTMAGYYNRREEQEKKFTPDGWLKTTDAGWLDADGYLHFVARMSELIIRHGENISPAEIECVAERYSRQVEQVRVVGVKADVVQEEIACLVKCRFGEISLEGLRAYIAERLASYKVPKYLFQVGEFPMTATGKIDQAATKRLAEELVRGAREAKASASA